MKKFINYIKKDKVVFTLFCVMCVALLAISTPILFNQIRKSKVPVVSVAYDTKIVRAADDKVKLNDNTILKSDSSGYYYSDFYITNLIDKINITFKNEIDATNTTNSLNILKTVYVYLIVNSEEGQVLQESTYKPSSPGIYEQSRIHTNNDNKVNLNQTVELDYSTYTDRLKTIKSGLGIECTGQIKIVYSLICDGTVNDKNYNYRETMYAYIPVQSSGTISVDYSYNPSNNITDSKTTYVNQICVGWLIFSAICDIMALALATLIVIVIVKQKKEDVKIKFINKCLNNYNDIIVYCDEIISTDNAKLKVKTFEDLVKVQVETNVPITYVKINNLHQFYIYTSNLTYYFEYDTGKQK